MAGASRFERRATRRRMLADDIPSFQANMQKVMDDRMTQIGVCSFSQSRDNILMWSHYASSHGGVCLRFRPTRADEGFYHGSPVAYSVDRPVINVMKSTMLEWAEKALFTKADYWDYEKEWRIFDLHEVGYHPFRPGVLDGIILGARISPEDRALVLNWVEARKTPTEVLVASFDPQRFRLVIGAG